MDVEHPIYDYEWDILKAFKQHQHIWILKSRGLGITELVLRYFAWKCLATDNYANKFIHIITGTKEEFAAKLIHRLANIFKRNYPDVKLELKYTQLILNKTTIQAYPTKQLKDLRGHIDVSFMFVDEGDFFDPKEQEELPFVIKAYEEKSNAKIIMVSTPNRPDGLFHAIEDGAVFKGFFHMLKLNYEVGLDKIYNRKFIEREMQEPEFEREYNLKYLGKVGNVFSQSMIDAAIELGESLKHLPVNKYTPHFGGIDPGFSKTTPLYIGEYDKENQCIRIVWWKRLDISTPEAVTKLAFDKFVEYEHNLHWFVDASNRGLINSLKLAFQESPRWTNPAEVSHHSNHIIPVNFGSKPSPIAKEKAAVEGHEMLLEHLHNLMSKGHIAIPKECTELITSLQTAYAEEWDLDKERTVYDDDLDSLRLLLKEIKIT